MPEISAETIAENAAAPKRVQGDQGSAEQHSIPDQIAADKYNRAGNTSSHTAMPFRLSKVSTGGAP